MKGSKVVSNGSEGEGIPLRLWSLLMAAVTATLGFWHASSLAWLCDDAFASFRYARNWARGLGLVFNAHERVEGITNPLWTLGLGVSSRLGFESSRVAIAAGTAAYIGCSLIILLTTDDAKEWSKEHSTSTPRRTWLLPVGAMLVIADPDWATFATGGLETSAFTFGVLLSYLLAWEVREPRLAGALAGIAVAITGMLRPDGGLFVAPLALAFWGKRRGGLFAYLMTCVLLLGGFHVWRRQYYGAWLPNTYYAKSALVSWWSQGFAYLGYFALRHAVVTVTAVLASLVVGVRLWHGRRQGVPQTIEATAHRLFVAWAMITTYTLSVVRVGGDFMYARLLVPVLPLLVLVLQRALLSIFGLRPLLYSALGVTIALGTFLWPCPVDTDIVSHRGIVDERAYYLSGFADQMEFISAQLRQCIQGYPTRAAIYGGELRLAYRAQIPYAIEAHAGLTDPVIAHKPLASRQRIGHEKSADANYLVMVKKAHFATSPLYGVLSDTHGFIPDVHADLCGVNVRLLHWDPAFVAYVRARGAYVPEFTRWLDALLQRIDAMPDSWVRHEYEAVRHFYFAHNYDPDRERVFERRLKAR